MAGDLSTPYLVRVAGPRVGIRGRRKSARRFMQIDDYVEEHLYSRRDEADLVLFRRTDSIQRRDTLATLASTTSRLRLSSNWKWPTVSFSRRTDHYRMYFVPV